MQACAQHIAYQLPNEHTRVTYLLDAIECSDAPLQAAMALVEQDTTVLGARNDFEKCAAQLLPKYPVVKRRLTADKRPAGDISATLAQDSSPGKTGIGQSGVHLRYHEPAEYDILSTAQRKELSEWRLANGAKKVAKKAKGPQRGSRGGARSKASIAATVNQQVQKKLAEKETQNKHDKQALSDVINDPAQRAYIMSLFQSNPLPTSTTSGNISSTEATQTNMATKPHVSLAQILTKAAVKRSGE